MKKLTWPNKPKSLEKEFLYQIGLELIDNNTTDYRIVISNNTISIYSPSGKSIFETFIVNGNFKITEMVSIEDQNFLEKLKNNFNQYKHYDWNKI